MNQSPSPLQPNPLGSASLGLGIASVALVFGIGFCSIIGVQQGWIGWVATVAFVCGTSSAFLGVIGALLGLGGLVGSQRQRSSAIAGLVLGLAGACLFIFFLAALSR